MATDPHVVPEDDRALADVLIVGAGPAGLYAAFYASWRGLKVRVVDSLSEPGGQLAAFYPDQDVHDVPGFHSVRASDLSKQLFEQALCFNPQFSWGQQVQQLTRKLGHFQLRSTQEIFYAQSVILAAGVGALTLSLPAIAGLTSDMLAYQVSDIRPRNRVLVVTGGGEATVAQVSQLIESGHHVAVSHFCPTIQLARLKPSKHLQLLLNTKPLQVQKTTEGLFVSFDDTTNQSVVVDQMLVRKSFHSSLNAVSQLAVPLIQSQIPVDPFMSFDNGLYAIGDVCHYPGKLKLIANAFAEAAIASNHIASKLIPNARYFPGHSTSRKF